MSTTSDTLTTHVVDAFTASVGVERVGGKDKAGAFHLYAITLPAGAQVQVQDGLTWTKTPEGRWRFELPFQVGDPAAQANGVPAEALLAVLHDRYSSLASGGNATEDDLWCARALDEVLLRLLRRATRRKTAG